MHRRRRSYLVVALWISLMILLGAQLGFLRDIAHSAATLSPGTPLFDKEYPATVIIASVKGDNLTWAENRLGLQSYDDIVIYVADDITAEHHPPLNKGREAMQYLTYLIDHYDRLPEIMIFVHASRQSWHNNTLLNRDVCWMLSLLRRSNVAEKGFVNLWCDWTRGCPDFLQMDKVQSEPYSSRHPHLLRAQSAFGDLFPGQGIPPVISAAGGGQFAVTRQTVEKIPLERLVYMRNWLVQTSMSSFDAGQVFEFFWHLIFLGTSESVVCPEEAFCYCQLYSVCLDHKSGSSESAREVLSELRNLERRRNEVDLIVNQLRGQDYVAPDVLERIRQSAVSMENYTEPIASLQTELDSIQGRIDEIITLSL